MNARFALWHFPYRRRHGHAHSLEHFAAHTLAFAPDGEPSAVVLDGDLLQGREVLLDVSPLEVMTSLLEPVVELLDQHQGQKAAKHVTPDGLVPLVEDGPRIEDALHVPEDLLNLPELLVLEGHLFGRESHIRPEHPLAVEPLLLLDLLLVDADRAPMDPQVRPVPLVADKGLRILPDLLRKRGEDGLPVCGILPCLPLVEADEVTMAVDRYLLHLQLAIFQLTIESSGE